MVFKITLIAHVTSGVLAFAFGLWALAVKKGSPKHMDAGKWFTRLMALSSVTAMVLATIKPQNFLFAVGVFTLYMLYFGIKALKYYRQRDHFTISKWEMLPHFAMLLFALTVFIRPIALMNSLDTSNLVVRVYGAGILVVCSYMGLLSVRNKRNRVSGNPFWLRQHIAMMCGAFVSSGSALIVNVLRYEPWWLFWTLPSLVGIIVIQLTIQKYKKETNYGTERSLSV